MFSQKIKNLNSGIRFQKLSAEKPPVCYAGFEYNLIKMWAEGVAVKENEGQRGPHAWVIQSKS